MYLHWRTQEIMIGMLVCGYDRFYSILANIEIRSILCQLRWLRHSFDSLLPDLSYLRITAYVRQFQRLRRLFGILIIVFKRFKFINKFVAPLRCLSAYWFSFLLISPSIWFLFDTLLPGLSFLRISAQF